VHAELKKASKLKSFIKNIKTNISIALGLIAGLLGFFFLLLARNKMRSKDKINYELDRVRHEMYSVMLERNVDHKKEKIKSLAQEEELIREKIEYIEKKESEGYHDISMEELEDFFNKRGK